MWNPMKLLWITGLACLCLLDFCSIIAVPRCVSSRFIQSSEATENPHLSGMIPAVTPWWCLLPFWASEVFRKSENRRVKYHTWKHMVIFHIFGVLFSTKMGDPLAKFSSIHPSCQLLLAGKPVVSGWPVSCQRIFSDTFQLKGRHAYAHPP